MNMPIRRIKRSATNHCPLPVLFLMLMGRGVAGEGQYISRFEGTIEYSHLRMQFDGDSKGMNGVAIGVTYNLKNWVGIHGQMDGYGFGPYACIGNGYVECGEAAMAMMGPRFSFHRGLHWTPFAEVLAGASRFKLDQYYWPPAGTDPYEVTHIAKAKEVSFAGSFGAGLNLRYKRILIKLSQVDCVSYSDGTDRHFTVRFSAGVGIGFGKRIN
jgi:hypothetical protein